MASLNQKTQQLLAYLAKQHSRPTITALMKLAYLVDLVSIKKLKSKISNFDYVRYYYGPYDASINNYVAALLQIDVLKAETKFTPQGGEYIEYLFNEDNEEYKIDQLSTEEIELIDEVMISISGYGAKTLTEMTYKTAPLVKLNATIGGSEHLNTKLDLNA